MRESTAPPPATALPRATPTTRAGGRRLMAGRLADRVVLVTGSSRGIGAEVAVKAAAEGATVAVHYRRSAEAAEQTSWPASASLGVDGATFAADIADGGQAEALVGGGHRPVRAGRRPRQQRRTDAGRAVPRDRAGPVGRGHRHRPHGRLPHLPRGAALDARAGRAAAIVNIASRLGQMGIAETAAYSAAKAGLIGLTRALAREFGAARDPGERRRAGHDDHRDDHRPRRQRGGPAPAARHAARAVRPGRRGGRRGDLPARRTRRACILGQTLNPNAGGYMP